MLYNIIHGVTLILVKLSNPYTFDQFKFPESTFVFLSVIDMFHLNLFVYIYSITVLGSVIIRNIMSLSITIQMYDLRQ